MRSIVLSGPPGAGKTTLGKKLAERLGRPFVDTDEIVEARAGKPAAAVWLERGEGGFRELEREIVRETMAAREPRVIAFGGGTVTMRDVRRDVLERATLVTLMADAATLARRITAETRPVLRGADREARIAALLEARAQLYAECHHTIDAAREDALDRLTAVADDDALVVPLGARSHRYALVEDDPEALLAAVRALSPSSVHGITDANVARARAAFLDGLGFPRITLTPGEEHKTLAAVSSLWDRLLASGLDRDSVIVGFGGGVVTDLAGFAAATALRGVRWIAAPTTLLGMVDASIGGKTGFDHASGKNRVGAFHQPSAIVADLAHLTTLPERERRAGLAEVVKVALTSDEELFGALESDGPVRDWVRGAALSKIRVVSVDEFEQTGERALLNFGHTFGHAVEVAGEYRANLHGEAVAIGIVAELEATHRLGFTPSSVVEDARAMLERLGLPTSTPLRALALAYVAADKKRRGNEIVLPVVRNIGEASIERIPLDVFLRALP